MWKFTGLEYFGTVFRCTPVLVSNAPQMTDIFIWFILEIMILRGNVKMSMSDKKLNSLSFLFDPLPSPLKTKVRKRIRATFENFFSIFPTFFPIFPTFISIISIFKSILSS